MRTERGAREMQEQRNDPCACADVASDEATRGGAALALFMPALTERPIAYRNGAPVALGEFSRHIAAVLERLPAGVCMLDLCEDRYRFLVAYAAAASIGHTVLLPSSRAEQVIAEAAAEYPGSYRIDDAWVDQALSALAPASEHMSAMLPAERVVMIGFTSGTTGAPVRQPKRWRSVHASTAYNAAAMRQALRCPDSTVLWVLATVPPQHMYGMEMSVLLPLIGGAAVHAGRPLFPADVAHALAELPAPRVLVSTPVHLRALVESPQAFPPVDLIICATAPLDQALAGQVERKLGGRLLELFGSTETCVFASRRTAIESSWRLYDGVSLSPAADGTLVNAPWFAEPVMLQDVLESQEDGRFVIRGRNADMIDVAGKRASLSELTRRLLAIEGVQDAVVFQPDQRESGRTHRVAALVAAPGLGAEVILERLARSVDPAFLPRPLVVLPALPRNEVGKLPRAALLQALKR